MWADDGPPRVPAGMGRPRPDQLTSTPRDNLIELAGRVCYDSLGARTSRDTAAYHAHINETGHHSTHEHAAFTVEVSTSAGEVPLLCAALVNRPGVWVEWRPTAPGTANERGKLRVTTNPRAVRDWAAVRLPAGAGPGVEAALGAELAGHAAALCPLACGDLAARAGDGVTGLATRVVPPESDDEVWVSLYLCGVSRGLTHELVRHGDSTAISQRSTRFVAESEGDWVPHPLVARNPNLRKGFEAYRQMGAWLYDQFARELEADLLKSPGTAPTARKQARGAARGLLGNALETQLVFSASVRQWKHIIRSRATIHADAEIRLAAADAYAVLSTHAPARFAGWIAAPCVDGTGWDITGP